MKDIEFNKMVASGNDFIVTDNRRNQLAVKDSQLSDFARKLCDRKFGIGADGLLIIDKSRNADLRMRIFNPDGSEAEMCGNGLRCAALWAKSKIKNKKSKISIDTKAGILEAVVSKDLVKVKMTDPKDLKLNIPLNINGEKYEVNFVNTGVPHTILFVNDIRNTNVRGLGKIIRFHPRFLPNGTNVDFVKLENKKHIISRTYERGVEDETLACGTGATAAALITGLKFNIRGSDCKIEVKTQSGEMLKIYFDNLKDKITNVYLEGRAEIVYKGVYYV